MEERTGDEGEKNDQDDLFDLSRTEWPMQAPGGEILWGSAHLHKGTRSYRRGGEIVLVSSAGPYTSSGLRAFIKTVPEQWYVLRARARLEEGDKAFVLAQDVTLTTKSSGSTEKIKPLLGKALVPRQYFFTLSKNKKQYTAPTIYELYFRAESEHTLIGLLFFRNFVAYRLAITEFCCFHLGDKRVGPGTGAMYQRFPLLHSVNKGLMLDNANEVLLRLAPYLHKFGMGPRLVKFTLFPLQILSEMGQEPDQEPDQVPKPIPAYVADIELGSELHKYLYIPPYNMELDPTILDDPPYLLELGFEVQRISLLWGLTEGRYEIVANGGPGTCEIRSADNKPLFLIYRPGYRTFYPRLQLGALCIPLEKREGE